MALVPTGEIVDSVDCLSFYWKDTTGFYTAENTGGYGTPNPDVADVTDATLSVILADGTTVDFTAGEGFYPLMPNTNGTLFQITNEMLGLSATTAITDWITLITYTVMVGEDEYIFTEYVLIGCQSKCCIANMNSEVDFTSQCAPCDNQNLQNFLKASAMLDAIYNALECDPQLPNKAAAILTSLTDFCASQDCGCGCA